MSALFMRRFSSITRPLLARKGSAVNPSSEKALLGAKMANEFFGEELWADIKAQSRDDLPSRVASEYVADTCFASYARPGLAFRDRSLMNIAMLIALNRSNELRIHIRAALYNGVSQEGIVEACRHAMVYCGVPAGRTALLIASEVFQELEKKKQV